MTGNCRGMKAGRGFSLLELVISCAILVTIFAFATTALTRMHRLRLESDSQTRMMTEGRALLDELADELAHVAGTNLWIDLENAPGGGKAISLEVIRYVDAPRSLANGEAYSEPPYHRISRSFEDTVDGPVSLGRTRAATDEDSLLYTNAPGRVAYELRREGAAVVTNAYAADEMGTHIPAAAKGDTISVPVTSSSSVTTYGSKKSVRGWVDVAPSSNEGTNTVTARVAFRNTHAGARTISIRRPVAGAWPETSEQNFSIKAAVEFHAENVSSNSFLVPGHLEYTNTISNSAVFDNAATNATATTWIAAELEAEADGEEVRTYPDDPRSPANGADAVPNDVGAATGDLPVVSNGVAAATNRLSVVGEVLYAPSDSASVAPDFWKWGDDAPANTNGIVSGMAIVVNGRTNTYDSASDVASASTSSVTRADAHFEFAETLDVLNMDFLAPAGLSNIVDISSPIAFTNEFAPKDATGAAIPIHVSETLSYEERATPADFAAAFHADYAAGAAGTNNAPLLKHLYRRDIEIDILRTVTPSGLTLRVLHNWATETAYDLFFDVPASLVPTNSLAFADVATNVFPNGTSTDSETRWHDVVLEEDFAGADERTSGIWLRIEGDRDVTELEKREESVRIPYARPQNGGGAGQDKISSRTWQSLQTIVITPLCFATNENERLDFVVWDPEEDPPGPPVCADIYIELLSPAHRLRADKMPDGQKRDKYIQDHVIRLMRRAPIGTSRRELP